MSVPVQYKTLAVDIFGEMVLQSKPPLTALTTSQAKGGEARRWLIQGCAGAKRSGRSLVFAADGKR